jgi:hypothetical protein
VCTNEVEKWQSELERVIFEMARSKSPREVVSALDDQWRVD